LVKKPLLLTPRIEPLYGTRDENLRLLEDGLNVQIDLRSDVIQVMGEPAAVARVEGIFAASAQRRAERAAQDGRL
jgi:phosphate starvation-inducible PhoH-like protein